MSQIPYFLTAEEQDELNGVVEQLRGSAKELERVAYIRDSNYVPGMATHIHTILDGYREVLNRQERALFKLDRKIEDRRLS